MLGRLNPDLGWKWRDSAGTWRPYYLRNISRNAGMVSGTVTHSGITATRPVQDFDLLSFDGLFWFPVKDAIALVPLEPPRELPRTVVPVQVVYRVDDQEVL